jgi:hypothetical protein
VILLRQELEELRSLSRSSTSDTNRRRRVSAELESRSLALRLRSIPTFVRKSLREYREYVQRAIRYFDTSREHDKRTRVVITTNALVGDTLDD